MQGVRGVAVIAIVSGLLGAGVTLLVTSTSHEGAGEQDAPQKAVPIAEPAPVRPAERPAQSRHRADTAADSTRIVVRRGDPGAGRDVRDALGMGRVTIVPDTLRRVDVSVILGRDFRIRGDVHP